jgi:hypothetical protein
MAQSSDHYHKNIFTLESRLVRVLKLNIILVDVHRLHWLLDLLLDNATKP